MTGGATTGEVYFLGDGLPLSHAPIADIGGLDAGDADGLRISRWVPTS